METIRSTGKEKKEKKTLPRHPCSTNDVTGTLVSGTTENFRLSDQSETDLDNVFQS